MVQQAEIGGAAARPLPLSLLRLARPTQWSKSAFCLIGPFYGLRELAETRPDADLAEVAAAALGAALLAAVAFALASSGCYVLNDLADREADRLHPRKRRRPIASGAVGARLAVVYAAVLLAAGLGCAALVPGGGGAWVALAVALHVLNVLAYSAVLKHVVIADVMSLALGFVLRVVGGCAAADVAPSVWLLNTTFFLSMFLAFGKRLGERRTLGDDTGVGRAEAHRRVQRVYTDALLQMAVVVTAVTTLMTYAMYVQAQEGLVAIPGLAVPLLWLTILPATYGLLRCIVVLEQGRYDDPTELAVRDRPFQLAGVLFLAITVGVAVL